MTNPLRLVREWFEEAAASGIIEAERMALATATPDGRPSVRIVLLKGIDDDGIQFFTNYGSRKGRELAANPRAAATLYWQPLYRAARLEGPVERLTAEESDAYFATRPRGAQVGAWASAQGQVLRDRAELDEHVREIEERFPDEVPRPDFWGGYRLRPDAVELWQGRPDRLHDREHFLLQGDGSWRVERLSP
jgi:pyridoxamine 5'-phosphate oxidase